LNELVNIKGMAGEYRAIVLDIDDTLVRSSPTALPSQTVVEAIREARNEGVTTHVATGRPYRMAKHVLKSLGIEDFCVVNGGSEIIDPLRGEEPVLAQPMTMNAQNEVLEICNQLGVPLYDSANQYGGLPIKEFPKKRYVNNKLFVEAIPVEQADELIAGMQDIPELAAFKSTSWMPGEVVDIHITDATATKKEGVDFLIDWYDLEPARVIGVGDSHIDIPLFRSVGLGVAMGNASAEVKAAANVIAPPLEEDGVAWVISNFILSRVRT
jgi:hydroxymethylpyrimidine pyrophosphatase-like HAD family hydrolase